MSRVKVWPLKEGIRGYDALGRAYRSMTIGRCWYMDARTAKQAAQRGQVQLVAGLSTNDLILPEGYDRAVMEAAPRPVPIEEEKHEEPEPEPEPESQKKDEELPKRPPAKKRARPAARGKYQRSDMTAED